MTSKKSFLASMKENNKRRIWVWIVSGLFWFFYFPIGLGLLMSRTKNANIDMQVTEEFALFNLRETVSSWIGVNEAMLIFVSALAILCAIQGFSYLYSRKKVDMYHSVPVSKKRRFLTIYMNGILIYLVPYFINMLLAVMVAFINGGLYSVNLVHAFIAFFLNLILYIGIYGLTIIAVMLTGNIIITLFATVIFLWYEIVARYVIYEYMTHFFKYYSYNSMNNNIYTLPPAWYYNAINKIQKISDPKISMMQAGLSDILICILLAVIFGVIAYWCYMKRPSEAAGKAMAFAKTKGIIKVLITIPVTLFLVLEVRGIVCPSGENTGINSLPIILLTTIVIAVLCSAIIEVIYEFDIRAAFKKKYHILISSACVVLIYCIFQFDLTGYDKWVPNPDKLESAVILAEGLTYRQNIYGSDLKYITRKELSKIQPGITDIDAICELSGKKASYEDNDKLVGLEVAYQMKNGKTIWRNFPVSIKEEDTLNKIFENQEFKLENFSIYNDEMFENFKTEPTGEITYNTGIRIENIPLEDMDTIRSLYIKDLNRSNYNTLKNELVCGKIFFTAQWGDGRNYNNFETNYEIYPSYTNIIGYLKEKGLYKEKVLYPEEILSITVNNYHYEYSQMGFDRYENRMVTKTFTEEHQIKELADALFPTNFETTFLPPDTISENYSVTVQLKSEMVDSSYYRGNNSFNLISDQIPDWLEKETAYE